MLGRVTQKISSRQITSRAVLMASPRRHLHTDLPSPFLPPTCTALDSTLAATPGMSEQVLEKNTITDEGITVHSGRPYVMQEDGEMVHHPGAITYPSAHGLAKFLTWAESKGETGPVGCLCNDNVLELGAGTGVVGLTLGKMGANVTITDVDEEIQPLQTMSMADNGLFRMVSCELDWAKPSTFQTDEHFDLVVGADCIYEGTAEIFAQALAAHLPHGRVGVVAVNYRGPNRETRKQPMESFFKAAFGEGLHVERLVDGEGQAAGSGSGLPISVYDGTSFEDLDKERWHEVAWHPEFSADNADKLQIFRVCRR